MPVAFPRNVNVKWFKNNHGYNIHTKDCDRLYKSQPCFPLVKKTPETRFSCKLSYLWYLLLTWIRLIFHLEWTTLNNSTKMCDNEAGAGVTGSMNTIIYSRGYVKSEQKVIFPWKVCVSCTLCIRKFFKNVANSIMKSK